MKSPLDSAKLHRDNCVKPAACQRTVQREYCYGSKFSKQAGYNICTATAADVMHFSDSVSSQSDNSAGHTTEGAHRMVVQLYSRLIMSPPQERHENDEQTSSDQPTIVGWEGFRHQHISFSFTWHCRLPDTAILA